MVLVSNRFSILLSQYAGLSVLDSIKVGKASNSSHVVIDGITKATVSVVVINETVLLSSLTIARKTLDGFATKGVAEVSKLYEPLDFKALENSGYIGKLTLSNSHLAEVFVDDYIIDKLDTQWQNVINQRLLIYVLPTLILRW